MCVWLKSTIIHCELNQLYDHSGEEKRVTRQSHVLYHTFKCHCSVHRWITSLPQSWKPTTCPPIRPMNHLCLRSTITSSSTYLALASSFYKDCLPDVVHFPIWQHWSNLDLTVYIKSWHDKCSSGHFDGHENCYLKKIINFALLIVQFIPHETNVICINK